MTINTEPQWYVNLLTDKHATKNSEVKLWETQWISSNTSQPPEVQANELPSINWLSHKDTEWLFKQTDDAVLYSSSFSYPIISTDGNYHTVVSSSSFNFNSSWFITIVGRDSKPLVMISNDGTVKLGEGVNMEDAVSYSYWRLLEACGINNKISIDVRNALGCSEGESIIEAVQALKRQVEELSTKVKEQSTAETDTLLTAYDRAMRVV